jgi:hypothetical protein
MGDDYGYTLFSRTARHGRRPIMHWLLTKGGSSLAERTFCGESALLLAARFKHFPVEQYLLEEQGSSINQSAIDGSSVWTYLPLSIHIRHYNDAELSSLLKVMVMLEDAPVDIIAKLSPQHAKICTRGRQLRAQLPSYLVQQRAAVVAHCDLPTVLQSLVTAYAATTPEDMWANGLRVQAPRAKRDRTKADKEDEEAFPVRRSLRLRQKLVTTDCMSNLY